MKRNCELKRVKKEGEERRGGHPLHNRVILFEEIFREIMKFSMIFDEKDANICKKEIVICLLL